MTETVRELSIARALTWRYIVALSLVASLSTAAWLGLHMVISAQKSTAAVVNISGRQRMLSQRTALFANLLISAPKAERPFLRSKLKDAIQLMERSHYGLTHGDIKLGLPEAMSADVHAMYFDGQNALDKQVKKYIQTVNELLLLDDSLLISASPQLQYITTNAPATLVAALDKMVKQYQLEGEASVGSLQKAETIFWLVTLLLLFLEALLIFKPFTKQVKTIVLKLQGVTNDLHIHQGNLEALIRQRTAELESRSEALAESEEKFRLICTTAKDGIAIIDSEGLVVYWNPAAQKIFNYEASEALGKDLHALIIPQRFREQAHTGFERFKKYGAGDLISKTIEVLALRSNGDEFTMELTISAFWFKHSWHALGIMRDITDRKAMEDQVRQLAFYDSLTALPNRRLFSERLSQAMVASKRTECYGALLFIDMDNFKPLNDKYGHGAGDLLLIEVANRLRNCVREMDTVGRFGGDEFVVMLSELNGEKTSSTAQAKVIAEKIRMALSQPYLLVIKQDAYAATAIEHHCTASIGVALFIEHEATQDEIIKWADLAMYQAKEAGKNLVRYYN